MKTCSKVEYHYTKKIRPERLFYYLQSVFKLIVFIPARYLFSFIVSIFSGKIITIRLKNGLIFKMLSWLDILTLKEVVLDREYESLGIKIEKEDKIIVDIGAGFGDFAILAAKRFPKAKIYAFEPDKRYFDLLKDNIILNKIGNIIPIDKPAYSLKEVFSLIQSNPIQSNIRSSM